MKANKKKLEPSEAITKKERPQRSYWHFQNAVIIIISISIIVTIIGIHINQKITDRKEYISSTERVGPVADNSFTANKAYGLRNSLLDSLKKIPDTFYFRKLLLYEKLIPLQTYNNNEFVEKYNYYKSKIINQKHLTPKYIIKKENDEFYKLTHHTMMGNVLGNSQYWSRIELNCIKLVNQNDVCDFAISVQYMGEDWLFIEGGESLMLLIDGHVVSYKAIPLLQVREVLYGGKVVEVKLYKVSVEQIKQICVSKTIKVRVRGKYHLDRFFTKGNIKNFQIFYLEHCTCIYEMNFGKKTSFRGNNFHLTI